MSDRSESSSDPNVQQQDAPKINIKSMGFPGEPYSMVLTNIFKEPDSHLNRVPPWGLPGLYQVTFVLGRPGIRAFPENEITFAQFMRGDSHLAILAPAFPAPDDAVKIALAIQVEGEAFVFEGLGNEAGFLAKLETKPFHAQNRNDAELRSTRAVQSVLSEYSTSLDIPLQIALIEVTENHGGKPRCCTIRIGEHGISKEACNAKSGRVGPTFGSSAGGNPPLTERANAGRQ